jgi:hypothetical protein
VRIYIKTAYIRRFKEPDESEWGDIACTLSLEMSVRTNSVLAIFQNCFSGKPNPEKQKPGAGCIAKLTANNKGLVAAALVVNTGGSLQQATDMCNCKMRPTV